YMNPRLGKYLLKSVLLMPFKSHFVGFHNSHLPHSYTKDLFTTVWEKEPELLYNTCLNKFRTTNDVNHWLMRYWCLASGKFSFRAPDFGHYFNISDQNEEM